MRLKRFKFCDRINGSYLKRKNKIPLNKNGVKVGCLLLRKMVDFSVEKCIFKRQIEIINQKKTFDILIMARDHDRPFYNGPEFHKIFINLKKNF